MKSWSVEEVQNFFNAHWTVRKYKDVKMPQAHLDTILLAAQRAPTDATAQMYSLIRLHEPGLRKKIAELTTNTHIATASEAFLICADLHRLDSILKNHNYELGTYPNISIHFAIGDAVMAGQNMLIAAELLGYRGCWIGGVMNDLEGIARLTQLPSGVFPFAALTIGVPDEEPIHRPRIAREHILHEDRYHSPAKEDLEKSVANMSSISARGNWAQTLARYFAKDGSMEQREPHLAKLLNEKIRGRK